ncbi:unnamed protein product [Durusdinium trenchii]|uniref:Uncharacterized protein n=1 Tax=Durusdinium trenchii TaxID=1381693 RepID=A0ABP0NB75_9DINO
MVPGPLQVLVQLLLLPVLKAQATTYELAFYHHFPVDISVCFAYGYGEPTTSIGPLNYKEVGYARIPANSSTNQISVDVQENCSGPNASLVSGAVQVTLQSSSNLFGVVADGLETWNASSPTAALAAYRSNSVAEVETTEVVASLRFWNGAVGLASSCTAEIAVDGGPHYQVGQLAADQGKQVSFTCDALESGFTTLAFHCGSQAFEFRTGAEGVGGFLCPGATLQVSLVGFQEGNTTGKGPSVELVSSSDCPCAQRCRASCAVAEGWRSAQVSSIFVLVVLWLWS